MRKLGIILVTCLVLWGSVAFLQDSRAGAMSSADLEGLLRSVEVIRDSDGVPHVFAQNDHDAFFMMGYLHARDRLFQADFLRRLFSGTLAELLGDQALTSDVELRTLGLRRAAEESYSAYSPELQSIFQAYADGFNSYVQIKAPSLPPEYGRLELTQFEPWDPIDSITVAKGRAFQLSFGWEDLDLTEVLAAYQEAGIHLGFDGEALLYQDLFRSAPFDPTVSIPNSLAPAESLQRDRPAARALPTVKELVRPGTLSMASAYRHRIETDPILNWVFNREAGTGGSNWWLIGGAHSASGLPLLANDPHLSLDTPPIFYEIHLTVSDDPRNGPMNVNGVSFAGLPAIAQGCNENLCWGSTVNPMDVTDFYQEALVVDLQRGVPTHTLFEGKREELVVIPQTYRVNQVGNTLNDDLATADVGPLEGGVTYIVPRRNRGPIIDVDISGFPVTAISVQYTGFRITREGEAFFRFARARNPEQFKDALQYFDIGSQNWAMADVNGNIAYFTSAELPLREDLEAGQVDGMPPFMIRDGTHFFRNEWMPLQNPQPGQAINFEILPFDEMPQVVNPAQGYIISANNDPVGTTLDNNVFNQTRASGGIFYLSPGYTSLRAGRIRQLIKAQIGAGKTLSVQDMMRIQSNNQLLDAEVFTPYILAAQTNGGQAGASLALGQLSADPQIVEAVEFLSDWDFSTPTGLAEGYDPGDDPAVLTEPSATEIRHSAAATIYAAWRSRFVENVIDTTLERLGLEDFEPPGELALSALRNLLENFVASQGVGASGVDFFAMEGGLTAVQRRDTLILQSLSEALDLLAGNEFAPAFNRSTNLQDYRWGYLHRIVFDHPVGGAYSIPPSAVVQDLSPELRGVARAGGLGAVDASSHSARAAGLNSFMFSGGPARRFVGEVDPEGIHAFQIIPGGQSGILTDIHRDSQLLRWLTNQYHPLRLSTQSVEADQVETAFFAPESYRLFYPFYVENAREFTGFALSSLVNFLLKLEFTAHDAAGAAQNFPKNPAMNDLEGSAQLALLAGELFNVPGGTSHSGWVEVSAAPTSGNPVGPALASFTQFGSFDLRSLDGGMAFEQQSRRLIFTRAFEGQAGFRGRAASTLLSIANPNPTGIQVRLRLFSTGDGSPASGPQALTPSLEQTATIPGRGFLSGTLSEIFGKAVSVSGGYVEALVTQGRGATGVELVRLQQPQTLFALNASAGTGRSESFSAQLASAANVFTNLNLVNISGESRNLALSAVDNAGTPLAETVDLSLGPGAVFAQDARDIFGFGSQSAPEGAIAEELFEGSIRVRADGGGVVGDVLFGDPVRFNYGAALALQSQTFFKAVFSQVANTPDFFTGLAFFNPGDGSTSITVQVLDSDGTVTGETMFALGPGQRRSGLVSELVPESAGQVRGSIVVSSTQPLVAQQLFGTFRLTLLSAVPPTIIE